MVVLDPYLQLAFTEAGRQALAVAGLGGAANGLAAFVEQDAVAAAEGRQRADHLQCLHLRLELLAAVFGIPTSKDGIDGSQVNAAFYHENDLEKIKKYCLRDVEVTARIFMAMHPQLDELQIEIAQIENSKKDHKD